MGSAKAGNRRGTERSGATRLWPLERRFDSDKWAGVANHPADDDEAERRILALGLLGITEGLQFDARLAIRAEPVQRRQQQRQAER